jgi:hypothetical protein
MADEPPVNIAMPAEEFPSPTLPTIFVDSILNVAPSPNVVKFYVARTDPSVRGASKYLTQPFAQVVMPMLGFIQTVVFFEQALKNFVETGLITSEQVDTMRKQLQR